MPLPDQVIFSVFSHPNPSPAPPFPFFEGGGRRCVLLLYIPGGIQYNGPKPAGKTIPAATKKREGNAMTILVSACLLGQNCKYSGGSNYCPAVLDFVQGHRVIPVCPEVLGGLPTPRSPAEIVAGQVINRDGVSVDREFRTGAAKALEIAREQKADLAILQSRSPSCGVKEIYDGSFTGRKIPGQGVFAALLQEVGIPVLDAGDLPQKGQE